MSRLDSKLALVVIFFLVSLIAFVVQTEATSYIYSKGFDQPYLLLFLTHGSWTFLWPVQMAIVSAMKLSRPEGYTSLDDEPKDLSWYSRFQIQVRRQMLRVYEISKLIHLEAGHADDQELEEDTWHAFFTSNVIVYILKVVVVNTVILTLAALTWYVAMGYSYSNDITAIYNCSAFFAYVFAVPLLHEKFSWVKLSSVAVAVFGVFIVVYSGQLQLQDMPHRMFGNILIAVGSVLYGYYDVFYKKYLCPPAHLVDPKAQALYSNFICSLVGFSSSVILFALLAVLYFTGGKVDLALSGEIWLYSIISVLANLSYFASMLVLMTLTSPVLGAVSSLTTIFLVGLFEWVVFGNGLSASQLLGDILVCVGFGILSWAYWHEIVEN